TTAAQNLVDAEKHHAREEQVLFPEMESRGVSGPTNVMRQEHDFLRPLKQRLLGQAGSGPGDRPFDQLKQAISDTAGRLVPNLAAHIQKEDGVLYPMALQVIDDPAVWEDMKKRCDEIGYCPFTG
ncbi:MAG: hemerythrin domain-containing protein, partial [Candidatus Neomarinimicrobiota bacterium]